MDELISDSYVEFTFGGLEPSAEKIKQFEVNYRLCFPEDKNTPVLDIGIGRGEMLMCMREWGYNYNGIDISRSTIKFCQALGLTCELVPDTIQALTAQPNKFGLITLLDVLEHIKKEQIIPTLTALRGALRPSGSLIVQVPNAQSRDAHLHRYNDFTHEIAFGELSLRQALLSAGFKRIEFFGFETIYTSGLRPALRKRIRAAIWWAIRKERYITGNLNPVILTLVLVAIA